MKVIIVSKRHGGTRSFSMGAWARIMLSLCVVGVPLAAGLAGGVYYSDKEKVELFNSEVADLWDQQIQQQQSDVELTRRQTQEQLEAMTLRVAELQARLVRLDALGDRLITMGKLDRGEFDFTQPPALGGPEGVVLGSSYTPPNFVEVIDQLGDQIDNRAQQLETLEAMLAKRKHLKDVFIAGRPVKKGWMSSRFGRRTDPFSGRIAWHSGVDFAGKRGSDIVAVAAGVITWSAKRHGYGLMVEVNHGNGYSTRYAHNQSNNVKVGDVVKKGQIISKMGSSGRSTGPHVHFEVYKNGRAVDPASYIHRASR
ncbi:MAG: M23 family metallopeptidase [Cellvibrionaceae bacterium]